MSLSPDPTGCPATWRWQVWFWPILLFVLLADQASKWALQAANVRGVQLPSWLAWHINKGVAWSMFDRWPHAVALLTAVLIPFLAWLWWRNYRALGRIENLAFGAILGGALGNGLDRGLAFCGILGGVRDFIHVDLGFWPCDPWPTFNLADAGITGGAILLCLRALAPAGGRPAAPVPGANV